MTPGRKGVGFSFASMYICKLVLRVNAAFKFALHKKACSFAGNVEHLDFVRNQAFPASVKDKLVVDLPALRHFLGEGNPT